MAYMCIAVPWYESFKKRRPNQGKVVSEFWSNITIILIRVSKLSLPEFPWTHIYAYERIVLCCLQLLKLLTAIADFASALANAACAATAAGSAQHNTIDTDTPRQPIGELVLLAVEFYLGYCSFRVLLIGQSTTHLQN